MVSGGARRVPSNAVPEILVATDTPGLFEEFRSVLVVPGTTVRWVRAGADVRVSLNRKPADLAIIDMQIGTMGGIGVYLDMQLEAEGGRLERCPGLIVLDRRPDVFLARRAGVEGWILKPLDPIRIRRAVTALLHGGTFYDRTYTPDPVAVPVPSDSIAGTGK